VVGVGVGVDVATLRKRFDGITNVFAGDAVGVEVNVIEGSGVTVGEIFELSVALAVGSKVTVGSKFIFAGSFSFKEELLDFDPKRYEVTPTTTISANRTSIII
jgi:hypothetical protein